MRKKFFYLVLLQAGIYCVQFILYPLIFGVGKKNLEIAILLIVPIIATIIGFIKITTKYSSLILSSFIYPILIYFYHPKLLFGIGTANLVGPASAIYNRQDIWFGILICSILLIGIELLTWLTLKTIRAIRKK